MTNDDRFAGHTDGPRREKTDIFVMSLFRYRAGEPILNETGYKNASAFPAGQTAFWLCRPEECGHDD